MNMLNHERLLEALHYDPSTGVFTRLESKGMGAVGSVAGVLGNRGYRVIAIDGRRYLAHRLAWLYFTGEWPADYLDHVNSQRDDNRIDNLRPATRSQNQHNTLTRATNTSGSKGVHWRARDKKWRARVEHLGKKYEKCFADKSEAVAWVCQTRARHHGEFTNHGANT